MEHDKKDWSKKAFFRQIFVRAKQFDTFIVESKRGALDCMEIVAWKNGNDPGLHGSTSMEPSNKSLDVEERGMVKIGCLYTLIS